MPQLRRTAGPSGSHEMLTNNREWNLNDRAAFAQDSALRIDAESASC